MSGFIVGALPDLIETNLTNRLGNCRLFLSPDPVTLANPPLLL
jgi:hypothetical protein